MFDFGKDDKGTVAIVFALTLLPTLGFAGAAVDYGRATNARDYMRKVSDQTALTIVAAEGDVAAVTLAAAKTTIEGALGEGVRDVVVTGRWLDDAHYLVRTEGDVVMSIVQAVPGMPESVAATVETVTRRIPPTYRTTPPERSLLEPEAADYNRIYMYCFDPARTDEADLGRRDLTPIADNASPPTDYAADPGWALPECGAGEVVSYMLRNVRSARKHPERWDDPAQQVYEYYADTTLDPSTRVMRHDVRGYRVYDGSSRTAMNMTSSPILETIRCRTDAECRPVAEGGIVPNRKTGRTPGTATQACEEGMFMYFGWEDRPPGFGWTDEDYDDIRLVVSCPEVVRLTDKQVMIVR
jgi:hypothetical protein